MIMLANLLRQLRVSASAAFRLTVLITACCASSDAQTPRQAPSDQVKAAVERYEALSSAYFTADREFMAARRAETNEEKASLVAKLRPDSEDYALKFLALARETPQAPTALDALN